MKPEEQRQADHGGRINDLIRENPAQGSEADLQSVRSQGHEEGQRHAAPGQNTRA